MTGRDSDRQIDQIIADWLESEPYTTPDAPVEAAIAFAYDHPRRPSLAWTRRDVMCRPLWLSLRPVVVLAALVGLLALTIGGVALLGARPAPTPEPSNEPGAGFMHEVLQGDAIDAALLGAWVPEDEYMGALDVAFHPASSEMCVDRLHTNQDCMTLSDPRNTFDANRGTFGGGIVVQRDGVLVYRETLGSPIRAGTVNRPCLSLATDEEIAFRLDGDRLHLEPSGRCWPAHDTGWWHRP